MLYTFYHVKLKLHLNIVLTWKYALRKRDVVYMRHHISLQQGTRQGSDKVYRYVQGWMADVMIATGYTVTKIADWC